MLVAVFAVVPVVAVLVVTLLSAPLAGFAVAPVVAVLVAVFAVVPVVALFGVAFTLWPGWRVRRC